jgi:hypothetical protein
MKMKYKSILFNWARFRLLLVVTCVLCSYLPNAYAEQPISVSFNCILWDMNASQIPLCYISKGKKQELGRLVNTQKSMSPYQYTGSPLLLFYNSKTYDASPDAVNVAVASVRIDPGLKEPLLVISKRKNGDLSIFSIEHSMSVYGKDTYRFYNTTSRRIAIKVDNSVMKLDPNSMENMIPDTTEHPNAHVKAVEIKDDGSIKKLYTNMWPKRKNQRYLCFITDADERKPGRIKVKVITDFVVKDAPIEEADGLLVPF